MLGVGIFAGLALGKVAQWVLRQLGDRLRNRGWVIRGTVFANAASPTSLLLFAMGLAFGLSWVVMSPAVSDFISRILALLYIIAGGWFLYNLVDVVDLAMRRHVAKTRTTLDDQIVPLVRKTLRIFLVVVVVLFTAENIFNADITAWMAGLGIAGLAVIIAIMTLTSGCVRKTMQKEVDRIVAEVLDYSTRIIEPELKLQRVRLDRMLRDSEKRRIDQYRALALVMADSMMNFQMKLVQMKEDTVYQLSDSEIDYYNRSQKVMRDIITGCWEILDNHPEEFTELQKEMYPKMVAWQKELMDIVSKNLPNSFRNEFKKEGLKILGMEQLGPNNMSPVFFLLSEPKTNFPLETLKEALLRTNLSDIGK